MGALRYGDELVLRKLTIGKPYDENASGVYFMSIVRGGVYVPAGAENVFVEPAISGKNPSSDYAWKLAPAAGSSKKTGEQVCYGDRVNITTFDAAGKVQRFISLLSEADGSVAQATTAVGLKDPDFPPDASVWKILDTHGTLDGQGISLSDAILFKYERSSLFLSFINSSVDARWPIVLAGIKMTGLGRAAWWQMLGSMSNATPDTDSTGVDPGTGNTAGVFQFPPKTNFGVTTFANSAATQTIEILVDNQVKATFTGSGTENNLLGDKILNSGKGSVQVKISANGKASQLVSNQTVLGGKLNFALVGSEDGTDMDYNDGIVVINWPLG